MVEYAALKVRIGLTKDGRNKYPSFNSLGVVRGSGQDWSKYVDANGLGWRYDNSSGHEDDTTASPRGTWWGMLVVDGEFADQAAAAFPEACKVMEETSAEAFYSTCVTCKMPEERVDADALAGMKAQIDLIDAVSGAVSEASAVSTFAPRRVDVLSRAKKALDPDDSTPGVRTNPEKTWAGLKAKRGFTIR